MPQIPYLNDEAAGPADLVAAIRERRGGELLNLDRILLHSPPLARGWGALLGAVRGEFELPALTRELAICTVASLTGADYELHHHEALFLQAGGSQAQFDALAADAAAAAEATKLFDAGQRALMAFAVASTRHVTIDEATFAALREHWPRPRQQVEIVALIAAYNMAARVLVASGITPE